MHTYTQTLKYYILYNITLLYGYYNIIYYAQVRCGVCVPFAASGQEKWSCLKTYISRSSVWTSTSNYSCDLCILLFNTSWKYVSYTRDAASLFSDRGKPTNRKHTMSVDIIVVYLYTIVSKTNKKNITQGKCTILSSQTNVKWN